MGVHGLSLMGTGDWNDGMNRVGAEGKGESVWNSWFLIATPIANSPRSPRPGATLERAATCRRGPRLSGRRSRRTPGTGQWYRRAYFDDGTPLGSSTNDECQIDSIAQSWAAISGVADPTGPGKALEAVDERLVHDQDGVILAVHPSVR